MSTKTINTRIKLRVDTAANWAASPSAVKIYKGEAALSLGTDNKYEMRIGTSDSGSTWAELGSSNLTVKMENVVGLSNAIYEYQIIEDSTTAGKFTLQKKLPTAETWTDVTSVSLTFTGTYSSTNPIALKDYVDTAVSAATTQYFEAVRGTVTEGVGEAATTRAQTDSEVITKYFTDHTGITVKGGSTFVIKTAIGTTGKYEYIAFTYDTTTNSSNPVWRAMDGNYNADNVYFTNDILATYTWGRYNKLTNGSVTIPASGKNITGLFDDVLSEEKQPGNPTQPAVTVTASNYKAYESGSMTDTLSYKATLSTGSYTYGPATGVTASSWTVSFNSETDKTTNESTFTSFRVSDTTNVRLTATATHNAGTVAVTNKNNASNPVKQIAAGSKTNYSGYITGFRYTFYGVVTTKATITSDVIRGLSGKTTSKLTDQSIAVGGGVRFIVAIPKSHPTTAKGTWNSCDADKLTKVLDENDSKANINGTLTKTYVDVNDANGENPISYSVYYVDFASAHDTDNFIVTQ